MTLQNVVFHDAVRKQDGVHMECLYAIVVPNLTISNSRFSNCASWTCSSPTATGGTPLPPPYGNVTLEGNHFETPRDTNGACCLYYGLYAGNTASPAPGSIYGLGGPPQLVRELRRRIRQPPGCRSVFCGNSGKSPALLAKDAC